MPTFAQAQEQLQPEGPLHAQALAVRRLAKGEEGELASLRELLAQADGSEAEAISWLIEGWLVKFGEGTLRA